MWEAYSKRTGPRCVLPFEALCHLCMMCSSNVEGGGLLADGQTLMQLATWGSAVSMYMPFRCYWTLVVPIVGG